MRRFYQMSILALAIWGCVDAAFAQNVTVTEASSDEVVSKRLKPTVDKVVKIDNYAKKMEELKKKNLVQAGTETLAEDGQKVSEENVEKSGEALKKEIEEKDIQEVKDNAKLSPQELLNKVREERRKQKEEAAAAPLKSSKAYNAEVKDRLKARREERKEMTKEERRQVKEELKTLYKARREERRNMTKQERRQIKEELKAKDKARREQQRADRKKRRQMRKMDK